MDCNRSIFICASSAHQPTPTLTPTLTPTVQPTVTPLPTSTATPRPLPIPIPTISISTTPPQPPQPTPTPAPIVNPPADTTNNRTVVIVFDDGWLNQYTNALPILQQYNYTASFSIISSYVEGQYPSYMSWRNIAELQADNFSIVSHSLSHEHLNELDNYTLFNEIVGSKMLLSAHNIDTNVFVYPYGEGGENSTVRDLVSQTYSIARGTNEAELNLANYDKYDLNAYAITSNITITDFALYCNHPLTIIYYHQITPSITDESIVSPAQLAEEMQYLKDNGYIVTNLDGFSRNSLTYF